MRIDFHVHTIHSRHHLLWKFGLIDGLCTPAEIVKHARKRGLTGVCLTDHNFLTPERLVKQLSKELGILVLAGAEVNIGKQEYIIIGCETIPKSRDLSEIRDLVKDQNGVLIAPHPKDPLGRGFREQLRNFDGIEVINGFGAVYNGESFGKAKLTGSDAHVGEMLGYSYTEMDAESQDDVLEAIRKARTTPVGTPFPKSVLLPYYLRKYYIWAQSMTPGKITRTLVEFVRSE